MDDNDRFENDKKYSSHKFRSKPKNANDHIEITYRDDHQDSNERSIDGSDNVRRKSLQNNGKRLNVKFDQSFDRYRDEYRGSEDRLDRSKNNKMHPSTDKEISSDPSAEYDRDNPPPVEVWNKLRKIIAKKSEDFDKEKSKYIESSIKTFDRQLKNNGSGSNHARNIEIKQRELKRIEREFKEKHFAIIDCYLIFWMIQLKKENLLMMNQ